MELHETNTKGIVLQIPKELNEKLKIFKATLKKNTLQEMIIFILDEYMSSSNTAVESIAEMLAGFSNSNKGASVPSQETTGIKTQTKTKSVIPD